MKLYFNGCSLTYGDELVDPKLNSWPSLVSKQLGVDFVNDAVRGGANDRILFRTVMNSDRYDFFFVAWSSYHRFTEYNPVDNFEISFQPQLNLNPDLHYSDDLKKNYHKYRTYGELFYQHWYNDLYAFKSWLQQIILLQSFLASKSKPYLMINAMRNNLDSWLQPDHSFIQSCRHLISFFDRANDNQLLEEYQNIQYLVNQIDRSRFKGWAEWCIYDLKHTHETGPGGHILESGHREVAEKVLEYYNSLK